MSLVRLFTRRITIRGYVTCCTCYKVAGNKVKCCKASVSQYSFFFLPRGRTTNFHPNLEIFLICLTQFMFSHLILSTVVSSALPRCFFFNWTPKYFFKSHTWSTLVLRLPSRCLLRSEYLQSISFTYFRYFCTHIFMFRSCYMHRISHCKV